MSASPPPTPSPFKAPSTTMTTRFESSQSASTSAAIPIPATPTSSLSVALAASSLQSQPQNEQDRSPTPPSPAQKHRGEPEREKGKVLKFKKRARGVLVEDEDEVDEEERERKRVKEERVMEGKSWSGKLDDQIIIFDSATKARDPLYEFEHANGGFMEELMMEFHLVLLEMHVWSYHRITSLRRKRRSEIKQSLEEIQAEEAKQEANRVRLLRFMNQIQTAVEGISAIDPLGG